MPTPAGHAGVSHGRIDRLMRNDQPLDLQAVHRLMAAAHRTAMEMLENAGFIERELVNVTLPDALLEETKQLCSNLVGTKHDIITELSELDELLVADAPATDLRRRAERIAHWLGDDVAQMQALVEKLDAARKEDSHCTLAWVLVTESAANVARAFRGVAEAAEECV